MQVNKRMACGKRECENWPLLALVEITCCRCLIVRRGRVAFLRDELPPLAIDWGKIGMDSLATSSKMDGL